MFFVLRKLVEQLFALSNIGKTCPHFNKLPGTVFYFYRHSGVSACWEEQKQLIHHVDRKVQKQRGEQRQVSSAIMSISVDLKRISNLPGRADRKVELSFRGKLYKHTCVISSFKKLMSLTLEGLRFRPQCLFDLRVAAGFFFQQRKSEKLNICF